MEYANIQLTTSSRSEFILAIQHAENNGFPIHPHYVIDLSRYNGDTCVVNVHTELDATGINVRGKDTFTPPRCLDVTTLEQFKHAVNCFCHDGYLNDENLGEI